MSVGHVENAPEKVRAFVEGFRENSVPALIKNLRTQVALTKIAGRAYPITLNDGGDPGNCYIANPVTGYIDYALDETRNFAATPMLRQAIGGVIRASAPLVRATGLDNAVHVNNWLFSTNPAPDLDRETAEHIRDEMIARYSDKAVIIRSLNTIADAGSLATCKAAGFRLLPSRQIYIFQPDSARQGMTTAMKQDRAKLRNTPYHWVGNDAFVDNDYARCAELYGLLYLRKYTPLNPQYTGAYVRQMHHRGLMELQGFRDQDGKLIAVTGLFENGNTLTQPIVGYDTGLPQKDGLYRMVMALAQDHALKKGLFFNMSAGAAEFKRRRGAVPAIEYSAVYVDHLARSRRWSCYAVETLLRRIGVPILQRFEL